MQLQFKQLLILPYIKIQNKQQTNVMLIRPLLALLPTRKKMPPLPLQRREKERGKSLQKSGSMMWKAKAWPLERRRSWKARMKPTMKRREERMLDLTAHISTALRTCLTMVLNMKMKMIMNVKLVLVLTRRTLSKAVCIGWQEWGVQQDSKYPHRKERRCQECPNPNAQLWACLSQLPAHLEESVIHFKQPTPHCQARTSAHQLDDMGVKGSPKKFIPKGDVHLHSSSNCWVCYHHLVPPQAHSLPWRQWYCNAVDPCPAGISISHASEGCRQYQHVGPNYTQKHC